MDSKEHTWSLGFDEACPLLSNEYSDLSKVCSLTHVGYHRLVVCGEHLYNSTLDEEHLGCYFS